MGAIIFQKSFKMKKIVINKKVYGSIDLPKGKNAYDTFVKIVKHYKSKNGFYVGVIFSEDELESFKEYHRGVEKALERINIYIEMSKILDYTANDVKQLKRELEFLKDSAYVHLDISGGLKLINKKSPTSTKNAYLFWDIENFSNIAPTFNHIIEPKELNDENIYVVANPDSLYLFRAEWEADLYDYSKTLNSFNFQVCGHGKNVADTVLVETFNELQLKNSDVYILTYDRELKERFKDVTDKSNNLYILEKMIL